MKVEATETEFRFAILLFLGLSGILLAAAILHQCAEGPAVSPALSEKQSAS